MSKKQRRVDWPQIIPDAPEGYVATLHGAFHYLEARDVIVSAMRLKRWIFTSHDIRPEEWYCDDDNTVLYISTAALDRMALLLNPPKEEQPTHKSWTERYRAVVETFFAEIVEEADEPFDVREFYAWWSTRRAENYRKAQNERHREWRKLRQARNQT